MTFIATLFEGRRAIVVGGTSGIGAGTALCLADLGADVLAVGLQAAGKHVPVRSGPPTRQARVGWSSSPSPWPSPMQLRKFV